MALNPTRRRFTVAEYYQMAEAGIFNEDDRVELIDGEVIEMTPIGRRHASCVKRLNNLFMKRFGDDVVVGVQDPVSLSEYSEPQPDLEILRPRPDFYAAGHPMPEDVIVLIEVAESSVEWDRRVKAPLYARSGVPELWLVDLEQDTVTIYRDATPSGYRIARVARRGEPIALAAFPDRLIQVDDILG